MRSNLRCQRRDTGVTRGARLDRAPRVPTRPEASHRDPGTGQLVGGLDAAGKGAGSS